MKMRSLIAGLLLKLACCCLLGPVSALGATTNGSISYSYDVPVDFAKVGLSAGIGSGGPFFDNVGNVNFPFYNFFYPAKNVSSAFVGVSIGL